MGEFASKGVAGAALGTGIAGLSLGVLNGMGGLLGGWGGNCCSESTPVNRYELTLVQEIASKDTRIGLLEADKYTDQKLTEVYKDLNGQISNLQSQINAQAVYNATMNGTVSCIQGQIAQLQGLTKLVVPNTSVCPGWGSVNVTPATTATTTTTPSA